jgi:hypothetical protein
VAEAARLGDPDDRREIRRILEETGVLSTGSPASEIRAEAAVNLLAALIQTRWRGEHEARASDRLELRGRVVEAQQELAAERHRREAAEARAEESQRDVGEALAEKTRLEFLVQFYERRHGAPVAQQLDDLKQQNRSLDRSVVRLQQELSKFLFLGRVVLAASIAAGGAFASWLPLSAGAVSGALGFIYISALALITTGAVVWILAGRGVAKRFARFVVGVLTVVGVVIEILNYRRK